MVTELSSTFRIRSLPQWPVWFPETLSMGVHPRARCRREMEGLAEMFRRSVLGGTDCQPPRNGHREQSWQSQDRRGPNDDQTRGRRPVALSAPQSKPQLEQRVLAELKCSLKKVQSKTLDELWKKVAPAAKKTQANECSADLLNLGCALAHLKPKQFQAAEF